MSVTINGIRGSSAYSGDLSGSFMSPSVVGIKGIAISGSPSSNNDTLLFNSASNQFYFSASVGGAADLSAYLTTANAASTYETIANVASGLALKANNSALSAYLTTASAASTYETIANVAAGLALKANASALSAYATTGSNTLLGNQIISGSTPLTVFGTAALTTSTLSTYPLYVKNTGSAGVAFGGVGTIGGRIEAISSTDTFTGNLIINGQGGGDVYLQNTSTQLIIGTSGNSNTNSKILVLASSATNNALDAVVGSILLRNGNISVTGSISSTSTISGSHTGTANLTTVTASNALVSNNLTVAGNLTVNGTMTSVNSTNLEITDKYILIASGAADAAALHGAGLQFGSIPSEDARIIYDSVSDEMEIYPAARSAEFRGAFVGDGSGLTGTPYDIAGDVSGSILSGSELMNYVSPRAFTMESFSQYTGSGAATGIVLLNGVSSSFPASIAANDLLTVVAETTGSKAYFTIKGTL